MDSEMASSCFKRSLFEWTISVCKVTAVFGKTPEFTYRGKKFYLEIYYSSSKYAMDMVYECAEAMLEGVTVHAEFADDASPRYRRSLPVSSTWWPSDIRKCPVVTIFQIDYSDIWKDNEGFEGNLTLLVNFQSDEVELTVPVPSKGLTIRAEDKSVQTSAHVNALPCLESLSEDLAKLLVPDSEPGVVLTCGDHKVKAHRNILCNRSEVFAAMLKSGMAENRTGSVEIADMEQVVFDQFVRYLHSAKFQEDLTVDIAEGLYEAADKYAIKTLMRRCASCLFENLYLENAFDMLLLADTHSDTDFKESVMGYIMQKEIHLKQWDRWLAFCNSQPLLALEMANRILQDQADK